MNSKTIRVLIFGGLGDVMLTTPSFEALKMEDMRRKIIVYCRSRSHMDVFRYNPYIDKVRSTSFLPNIRAYALHYFKLAPFQLTNYGRLLPSLFYKKNATEIIAEQIFNVQLKNNHVQLFFTEREERVARSIVAQYKNPIAIHITSVFSANQMWPLKNWEELIKSLPGHTFIQLGLSKEQKVEGAIDYRGKTSFRQALAILKYVSSFVGVVSSFAHATSAFAIPGVVLFGASAPEVWGHANNINLSRHLRCAPCIDHFSLSACPYSSPCMSGITVEEVREALLKQLGGES